MTKITVQGGTMDESEQQAYVSHLEEKYHQKVESLHIRLDGEEAELSYKLSPVPFERIRRITGYLVGTMDRWNNAKQVEESDRVKHAIG